MVQNTNSLEKHSIKIYNATNVSDLYESSTVTTLYPKWVIFTLIFTEILLSIVIFATKDLKKCLLLGIVTISLAIYTSSISTGYEGLYILPVIILIANVAYTAIKLHDMFAEGIKWY